MEATVMTALPAAPKPVTYHVGPWRYIWLWFVFGLLALLCFGGALWSETADDRAGFLAGGAVLAVMLAALQAMIFRARLTLSEQGVCLRQIGYRIEAPWSDIVALRLGRGREGFVTAHPIESKGMRRLADAVEVAPYVGYDIYDREQHVLLAQHRLIPIEAFAWHIRSGSMRAAILRYAPHLRNDMIALNPLVTPKPQPGAPAQPKIPLTPRKKLLLVAMLAAFLLFWGVLFSLGDRAVATFATIAYALVSPMIVLATGINAWILLRRKSWLMGFLLVAMTVIALCWTILDWSRFAALLTT